MRIVTGALLFVLATIAPALGDGDTPRRVPVMPGPIAESRFNEGLALQQRNDFRGAERAYRDAIRLSATMPEAWNGLGYSLRKQKKYDESIRAYQEALRLRPAYPQALEYLGEAYLQMGRLEEAREVLARLRPLDPREADELAEAIAKVAKP